MAQGTNIEWTDATWNPIAGCNDVSEGCRLCYARGMARRLEAMGQEKYTGLTVLQGSHVVWTGKISFDEKALLAPLKRKKPTRYFVNSMSDLFHKNVTDEMRDKIYAVMALCPQHTFQVLTKRAHAMFEYMMDPARQEAIMRAVGHIVAGLMAEESKFTVRDVHKILERVKGIARNERGTVVVEIKNPPFPLPNVWLGVSAESQEVLNVRVWPLLQTPAAVRFLSAEPLLGPLDLNKGELLIDKRQQPHTIGNYLDWVIVGGESGPEARLLHPDWVRDLRDQCKAAGVAFFFKQWGAWIPWEPEHMPFWVSQHGKSEDQHALFPPDIADDPPGWDSGLGYAGEAAFQRVGKKAAGHLLDGEVIQQFPGEGQR